MTVRQQAFDVDVSPVAALIGDRTRAAMLSALMSGTALTAGELATAAGVSPATASSHLAHLLRGELVAVEKQGRHRYYRLRGQHVAVVMEALARVSPPVQIRSLRQSRTAAAMRNARTCYDHLAGRAGVSVYAALADKGWLTADGGAVSDSGERELTGLGIDVVTLTSGRRRLVRPCLDWTERRPHLAGALGAAVLRHVLDRGWLVRERGEPRILRVTEDGEYGFATAFGIDLTTESASVSR